MSDTLLLNASGEPISFLPLSTITWQDAIKYLVLDKAQVLAWHDDWIVHSATWETAVPSVLILREYMKPKMTIRFSKSNVFLRDSFKCAYCEDNLEKKHCTLDHVLPVSHGGKTTFENCVTSCGPCNAGKGNNKKIKPKFKPHKPDFYELVNKRKKLPFQVKHAEWMEYLS
jgi:5-methylcytosine-specific restriction endonuclease McrA